MMNIYSTLEARSRFSKMTLMAALSFLLYGCASTEELYAQYDEQACRVSLVEQPNGTTLVQELVSDRAMTWEPSVLFEQSSANLGGEQKRQLDQDIAVLIRYPELQVSVRGFADASGSIQTNRELSARRAATVARYMKEAGIDSARIQETSAGESLLIKDSQPEAAVSVNRRVELVLIDVNGNLVPYNVSRIPSISAATEE